METVVVLHTKLFSDSSIDDLEVLEQANNVSDALSELGYQVVQYPFSTKDSSFIKFIGQTKPVFVFNLVEPTVGEEKFSYVFAPAILEILGIKFTGCNSQSALISMNKLLVKQLLREANILTPEWVSINEHEQFDPSFQYIVKPVSECTSIGIDENPIHEFYDIEELLHHLVIQKDISTMEYFAERYVSGREFTVAIIGRHDSPQVLPPGELIFDSLVVNKKHPIYSYKAKWITESLEYQTIRSNFSFDKRADDLIRKLKNISLECWSKFNLRGYATIDFRVDQNRKPWVIDINANPSLTYGPAGLVEAAMRAGLGFLELIKVIIS